MSDEVKSPNFGLQRRLLMTSTLAGLAAAALPGQDAWAAPATPGSGRKVGRNPIQARIVPSGIKAALVPFSTPPATDTLAPKALLNHLHFDPSGRLFVCDSRGKMWHIDQTTGAAALFLDMAAARGSRLVTTNPNARTGANNVGFRSFAFHPNFFQVGQPGHGKFYTSTVEKPRSALIPLPCGTFRVVVHTVVAEWTVDALGMPSLASRREVLRTAHWDTSHNLDTLLFDPSGQLMLTVGDGGNLPRSPDPYNLAQNTGVALGKVLRINPLASGTQRYTVPADNPFVGVPGFLPEIWCYGLRHPQHLCFDPADTRMGILVDVGQKRVEEVNILVKGANYGWANREGTWVTDRASQNILYGLPANDASYGYTYPVVQYDHDEGIAICGGYVYRGTAIPALQGHYIFGDIANGRVFHVPVASLVLGQQTQVSELTLTRNGLDVTLLSLVGAANNRVDLRFGQDQAGEMYVMTKQEGTIYKLAPA